MIEQGIEYSRMLVLAPVIAITLNQVRAILKRDGNTCTFFEEHICKGKLTVHHIEGKEDTPENLTTVCHQAHWGHLHNGASDEQKSLWAEGLKLQAQEKTASASESGWLFPDE